MVEYFYIVQFVATFQVLIIIGLLLFSYGFKVYHHLKDKKEIKIKKILSDKISKAIEGKEALSIRKLHHYRNYLKLFIDVIREFDEKSYQDNWLSTRQQIMDEIILPSADDWAGSRHWENRYLSCQAYQLYPDHAKEEVIKTLIEDPVIIVAMNAATLAVKKDSQYLVDAVINSFSKGRSVQQSLYAQTISSAETNFSDLLHHRLLGEKDLYKRAFCYRTLAELPYMFKPTKIAFQDIKNNNLNLKLAVMSYLAHCYADAPSLFVSLLDNKRWEIRARAAKLLGSCGDSTKAIYLEKLLRDPVWWVRLSAAESLAKLGEAGKEILMRQSAEEEPFAYDIANKVLTTLKVNKGL